MIRLQKKSLLTWLLSVIALIQTFAQNSSTEGALRRQGGIYIVIIIIAIILTGLYVFLFLLERKIKRIEKHLNK
ncbi:MAG: hypothetical protein NZ529_01770 [Cytophagaceae bacterium]|nr:hypothetical protein [Cytophagaceae bacterium]MDW8455495.1 hypothetical protein [Cytophagaceae bacterium]